MVTVVVTANEQERRFEFERPVSQRTVVYTDANQAVLSPLASKLFGFSWTEQVTIEPQALILKKQEWVGWDVLEAPLKDLLSEHLADASEGPLEENPEPVQKNQSYGDLQGEEAQVIQTLIEQQINPALANHGGYVVLHGIKGDEVFLEMGGGCQGCAMSYQTLKEGIEGAIQSVLPQIRTVTDITRHEEGVNPYFQQA